MTTVSTPYYDRKPAADFGDLCSRFSDWSFQSPYRSTVPLLALFRQTADCQRLLTALGAGRDAAVHVEYGVPSPKPGGRPSQTDVLLTSGAGTWAIEAKWTEPRYETVKGRPAKPEADGAGPKTTVGGWLKHLQAFTPRQLKLDDFNDMVYQIVHRAASACAAATERGTSAELVYLHFHPSPLSNSATTAQYVADLRQLRELLGAESRLGLTVVEMSLSPTAAFDRIKDLDKRQSETAKPVRKAVCEEMLFEFGAPMVTRIHPS